MALLPGLYNLILNLFSMFNNFIIWELEKVNHKNLFAQFSINPGIKLEPGKYIIIKLNNE